MLNDHSPVRFLLSLILPAVILSSCAREIPPEQKQADQILSKARDAFQRKLYHESRTMLWQAYELDSKLGRVPQMAEGLELLGAIYAAVADFDSALALRQDAMEKYRSLADRASARALLIENALLYRQMGDERRCYAMLAEAIRLARVFKDDQAVRELQWEIIPSLRELNHGEEEASTFQELLKASLASNDIIGQARVHREEGISALHRRQTRDAEEALLRALTLAEQVRDPLFTSDILYHLGITHAAAARTKDALDSYTEALRRAEPIRELERLRVEMMIRAGNIHLQNGSYAEAARFYRTALTGAINAGNKLLEGYLFIQLGHCEANVAGAMENAQRNYSSALELFQGVSYDRGISYAQIALGRFAQRGNRVSEALQHFKQAAEAGENWIARAHHDLLADCELADKDAAFTVPSEPVTELMLQLGRNEEAFWYATGSVERSMHAALNAFELKFDDSAVTAVLNAWRHARARYIGAVRQLERILQGGPREQDLFKDVTGMLEKSRTAMEESADRLQQTRGSLEMVVRPKNVGLEDVQKRIPRDAAMLMYVPTRRTLYAFLVTPTRVTVHVAAVERSRLAALARQLQGTIQQRFAVEDSSDAVKRAATRALDDTVAAMYSVLVRPFEAELATIPRLLVVAPGEVAGVPVHALRKGSLKSHRYVAEQTLVSFIPSPGALSLEGSPMKSDRRITGIGHPGATDWDVEYELRDIRAFYKDTRLLFGQQATPAALAGDSADVLHIAAEVRYSAVAPGSSTIVFSDGKSFSSVRAVPWGELVSWPAFPAVVLSNLGQGGTMEQATLAQMFLMNNSSHVVLNGWLPARRTKKFFGEIFYTNLLAGGTTRNAFRQVQLEMIKTEPFSGPHAWGAFFLWGK